MRDVGFDPIWNAWTSGGPFVGELAAPHSRVTVDKSWWLNLQGHAGSYPKCPIRWFQRIDNSQVETEIPNVKSISWDRSLDNDAASMTLVLYNQEMLANAIAGSSSPRLGQPGALTWRDRGPQSVARWGEWVGTLAPSTWKGVITPDALIRTYQGYGGNSKTIHQAVIDGNLAQTGCWLVDDVQVKTDGTIDVKCRDMAKLLIDQALYPPLVPANLYPQVLSYYRYIWVMEDVTVQVAGGDTGPKRCVYQRVGVSQASSSDMWAGPVGSPVFDGRMHGHYAHEAFDGNPQTWWASPGNDEPWEPYALEWIEAASGDWIDTVHLHVVGGGYRVYISVMEGGNWVAGGGTIPYSVFSRGGAHIGRYEGNDTANIPWVIQTGVPPEGSVDIRLPRAFRADKIRISLTGLPNLYGGGTPYAAGVRDISLFLANPVTQTSQQLVRHDGNYRDYSEIIRDMALWAGFYAYNPADPGGSAEPAVFGNIESTGANDNGTWFPVSGQGTTPEFDKKTVIDAMHVIRDVVGYLIWVDEEGGFHFESANKWKSGNFRMDGMPTPFIPDIDEKIQLTDYQLDYADKALRSQIIVSSNEPTANFSDTVTTYYDPGAQASVLRGIVKPMVVGNHLFTDPAEQQVYARLVALAIEAATYQGSVTCPANPCISLNDQVRIHERITSETGIHYVKGISCQHDLDTGDFKMTLATYRLGDDSGFTVTASGPEPLKGRAAALWAVLTRWKGGAPAAGGAGSFGDDAAGAQHLWDHIPHILSKMKVWS